jgi:penicillin-binding protein 2
MVRKRKSLGFGFSDEVGKVTDKTGHFKKTPSPDWADFLIPNFQPEKEHKHEENSWRVIFFFAVCLVSFFIIFVRLFHLQIVRGSENRSLADGNRIQVKIIHAPRGVIFDRNGKILAANSPAFRFTDPLAKGYKVRLVTREEAMEWEVRKDPRALSLEVDNVRNYPLGEKFAHVIGFLGEISETQLKNKEYKGYRQGDQIGQMGVEAEYEKTLRGIDGGEIIEVDSLGRKVRTLRMKPPIPGQNVYLSIDASLQEKIFDLVKETLQKTGSCCGAVVAADPGTGKILALLSLPSFDPNLFTKNPDERAISEIFLSPVAPILNRVIGGTYPPGSTYKIVSSLAALDSGQVTETTSFQDNGVLYLGPYKFSNWYFNQYGKTEGSVDLLKALQRSNDIYFYEIARLIGEDSLIKWSKKLYLGSKLNIDLPGEVEGLVPDDKWKQKTYNQPWYPGDTLHMSIGQGFVLTTPLQILGVTSYIAVDGVLYKPQLLLSDKPKILTDKLISQEKLDLVKKGLMLVPKEGGTAWPFFTFPIQTAGKTGTAEYGDPKDRTHAWYTSFAPVDDPKIALTVLIEGGGEGSSIASPIAKEAFRFYFSPDKSNLMKDIVGEAASSADVTATDSAKTLGE